MTPKGANLEATDLLEISEDTGSGYVTKSITGQEIISAGSYGLYAQTALGTLITNTITETSLVGAGVGTLFVPANAFSVGNSFIAKMCGNISCAGNETIRIRIKSNGVTIADAGVFSMKITTDKFFELTSQTIIITIKNIK